MNGLTEIKRRSARAFIEEEEFIGRGRKVEMDLDSRKKDTDQIEMQQSESRGSSNEVKARQSMVNLGRDTNIFPTKEEDIESHIAETLQAAKTSIETKQESQPSNLGVVIPGKMFRSSWPTEDDFINLESLGLKTHRTGCVVAVVRHVARWDVESILEEYRGYAAPKARECDINYIAQYDVSSLHGLFSGETLSILPQQHEEGGIAPAVPLHHGQDERPSFPPWRTRMKRCLVVSGVALGVWIYSGLFWRQRHLGWTLRN
ncbi:tyrosine phosphatase [Diplocarpon rosae]|nr:tyrosine phosphatase [Diplocarpon rosae]